MPDLIKFSGDDDRTTWEHIRQYTAQLGKAVVYNALTVCLFSLSLTGTAFAWFFFACSRFYYIMGYVRT
jgi:hypothetical protein